MKYREFLEKINEFVDKEVRKEVNRLLKEEPEDPKSPFGKYAFDLNRDDVPKDQKEPNTRIENQALDALEDYIGLNAKQKLTTMAPLLLNMVKQGKYKPILDPGSRSVYRVMQVPQLVANKLLRMELGPNNSSGYAGPGVLQPYGGKISGWTSNPELIRDFSGIGEGNAMILFVAGTRNNNFFGNPGHLAVAAGEEEFAQEMEVIGLGPIRFGGAAYVLLYDDNNSYFDSIEAEDRLLELIP